MTRNAVIKTLLGLIFKKPKYLLIVPLIAVVWYGYEYYIARPAMSYMGVPKVENNTLGLSHVLRNQGFMLEYSETLKNPIWVTYKVTEQKYKSGKRPSNFRQDWRSWSSVSHSDYTHSGYNRGHMAPNYVIASRYGRNAQYDTFLMTNITPQKPKLNQKSWQRLEEVIANDFSEWHGDFWVTTGPIFGDSPKEIKKSGVKVPDAFYKILIKPSTKQTPAQALAFIFPQDAKARASLMSFVSSIDEVEKATGIDFFHKLEDEFENKLEASKTPEAWRLQEVANRASRY